LAIREGWIPMDQANWGGIAAIGGLYVVFVAVGWAASRRLKLGTAAEYLVAGRAMPFWMATITMAATWIDGGYLLGTAEGVFSSLASGWQGGVAFGLSLVIGGLVFARRMRELEFVTLVDPLAARFGKRWGAVLSLPAMLGELFWSAELLVAVGASLGVILGVDLTAAILISAAVVTFYTMLGGMWSVGYTDAVQFALIPIGLLVALPFALSAVGGLTSCWSQYVAAKGTAAAVFPPLVAEGYWTSGRIVHWWDLSIMLVFGGIPWNCYFQRVQSCKTPAIAQWQSIAAGLLTIVLTVPPLLFGLAAFTFDGWTPTAAQQLQEAPTMALPLLLVAVAPAAIAVLGLTAIVGAVTSSFSASILSAASMISWNVCRALLAPDLSARAVRLVVRLCVVVLGIAAAVMALRVQSVQQLWFFTSDLVFVLVFPQLLYALFDPRANRTGSIVAFFSSLVLRLGEGEPILALPALVPYAQLLGKLWPGEAPLWFDDAGHATLFPVRTVAAVAGLVLLPLVSRLTARWDPPRLLRPNQTDADF
jgi:solute carrier family 5 (high affinity choline transporter), member 7